MMTEEPTILTVGSELKQVTDSSKWDEIYNIKGYENVFLDLHSLANRLQDEEPDGDIYTPGNSAVMTAMEAGNQIFIILPDSNSINLTARSILPLADIIPGDFSLVEESGKYVDLDSVAEGWEWYFNNHFDWHLRLDVHSEGFETAGQQYALDDTAIVRNKSQESIAWSFKYNSISQTQLGPQVAGDLAGKITFLPVIGRSRSSELIESLIEHKIGVHITNNHKNSPKWTSDWSLPGEDDVKTEVKNLEEEIAQKKSQLESLDKELTEYKRYKTLLWGNENPLEQLVPEVFDEMGLEVEGEEPHGRDGMIHLGDRSLVLEITGTKNDISDDKYEQLLGWVVDAEGEDKNTVFDGLLIVNPRREENPSERNPDEYLPTHLRRRIERRGFNILLTPTLYKMLKKYRAGEIKTEDIREELLSDELIVEI